MENFDLYTFNEIRMKKTFDISALITAYSVPQKINEDPYWEYYGFSQIFLVLEGEGQYETEDGSYPIEAGMMFYRPANKRSCYRWNTEKVRFALISFVCTSPSMACLGPQHIFFPPFYIYRPDAKTRVKHIYSGFCIGSTKDTPRISRNVIKLTTVANRGTKKNKHHQRREYCFWWCFFANRHDKKADKKSA